MSTFGATPGVRERNAAKTLIEMGVGGSCRAEYYAFGALGVTGTV